MATKERKEHDRKPDDGVPRLFFGLYCDIWWPNENASRPTGQSRSRSVKPISGRSARRRRLGTSRPRPEDWGRDGSCRWTVPAAITGPDQSDPVRPGQTTLVEKIQSPGPGFQTGARLAGTLAPPGRRLEFGYWSFFGSWCLRFGASSAGGVFPFASPLSLATFPRGYLPAAI